MPLIAPAYVTINPHFMEPDIVVQYTMTSNAFRLLPGGVPRTKLSDGDLAVYIKTLQLRTKAASGQSSYNQLPSVEMVLNYSSTPTYLTRCRAEYDHHDMASASRWGLSLQQGYRLGMRQSHFLIERTALLYGMSPAFGEGLTNAVGATSTNLPADSYGNTTITTYDNGQMGQFLLNTMAAIKTRTNNMGAPRRFVILAPQRVMQQWEYNVVQLVQYQRAGAGTESIAGMAKMVMLANKDEVEWCMDDTLIGKGSGGTDLIVFVMPEIDVIEPDGGINTNEFAKVTPGFLETTAMYTDMVAPREITTPIAGGAVDVLTEHRISSGWGIRPEAITLLSASY